MHEAAAEERRTEQGQPQLHLICIPLPVLTLSPLPPSLSCRLRVQIISGFDYATLATVSIEGRPASRTIWIREVYQSRALLFTTDARSPKVEQLDCRHRQPSPSSPIPPASPPVAPSTSPKPCGEVCWYLPMSKEQFRLTVHATLITATHPSPLLQRLRHSVWASSPHWLQSSFSNPAPGVRKGEGADEEEQVSEEGGVHRHFVVVLLWPVRCDFMKLPITVIDNSRPLHRESRLKPQKEQMRFLHTRLTAEQWTVTELNP